MKVEQAKQIASNAPSNSGRLSKGPQSAAQGIFRRSLDVTDDASALNSVPALVEQINTALNHAVNATGLLKERLTAGYNPAEASRYMRQL
jgi:hypothetical protein